jgi:hypothetical protein
MKLGTKSLLFGAHQFLIHPLFVALAWIKLYGFPWDPRLWVAFFVHDLGYWGCADLDGPRGKYHPLLGAKIMNWLFDRKGKGDFWFYFMACHSRTLAQTIPGAIPSRLCYADKISLELTPSWLWLFCARLSGEGEYFRTSPHVRLADPSITAGEGIERAKQDTRDWFASMYADNPGNF